MFNAGAFSAAVMCLFTAPIERVKCLLQVQSSMGTSTYNGPLDVAKKLYKKHGITAVYRGFLITLARGRVTVYTRNTLYSYVKDMLLLL